MRWNAREPAQNAVFVLLVEGKAENGQELDCFPRRGNVSS